MTTALLVNMVGIALLLLTIFYAFILNHRLKKLRDSKDELQQVIARFSQATKVAENTITTLKKTAHDLEGDLRKKLKDAETLYTDLKFIIQKGEEVATKLEHDMDRPRSPIKNADAPELPLESKSSPKQKIFRYPKASILQAIRDMR